MLRVFVDSGSSIKVEELEKYNVELIPLKVLLNGKEYLDGVNLTNEIFYHELIENKQFPKTSLPPLGEVEERVNKYVDAGDDVIIVTISSKISGTYNAIKLLFDGNNKVKVIDSYCAVGGIRLIIDEINKYRDKSLDFIEQKVKEFIPKICIMAIPESLHYLFKGGRLSKTEWLIGSILIIKPIIGFRDGAVHVVAKKHGLKSGMKYVANALKELNCDPNYDIIASYTYNKENLNTLISLTDEQFKNQMNVFDNLDPAIACHWGPNAFGYIFVSKDNQY